MCFSCNFAGIIVTLQANSDTVEKHIGMGNYFTVFRLYNIFYYVKGLYEIVF